MTLPLGWSDAAAYVATFWLSSALVAGAGRLFRLPAWGRVALVVAACAALPTPFIWKLAVYPLALVMMLCVVVCGIRKASLFLTNVGAATFLWLVVAKFFASHAPFTVKGIVLIVAGLALTALNVGIVRIRKTRRA